MEGRMDIVEVNRSQIIQGLGSQVAESELFPATLNPYDSAHRLKLGCVSSITGLKPWCFFPLKKKTQQHCQEPSLGAGGLFFHSTSR